MHINDTNYCKFFQCDECDQLVVMKWALKNHIENLHEAFTRQLSTPVCSFLWGRRWCRRKRRSCGCRRCSSRCWRGSWWWRKWATCPCPTQHWTQGRSWCRFCFIHRKILSANNPVSDHFGPKIVDFLIFHVRFINFHPFSMVQCSLCVSNLWQRLTFYI